MRMKDPIPQFTYVVEQLAARHPNLAYIQAVEPRVNGNIDREVQSGEVRVFPSQSISVSLTTSSSPMTSFGRFGTLVRSLLLEGITGSLLWRLWRKEAILWPLDVIIFRTYVLVVFVVLLKLNNSSVIVVHDT